MAETTRRKSLLTHRVFCSSSWQLPVEEEDPRPSLWLPGCQPCTGSSGRCELWVPLAARCQPPLWRGPWVNWDAAVSPAQSGSVGPGKAGSTGGVAARDGEGAGLAQCWRTHALGAGVAARFSAKSQRQLLLRPLETRGTAGHLAGAVGSRGGPGDGQAPADVPQQGCWRVYPPAAPPARDQRPHLSPTAAEPDV